MAEKKFPLAIVLQAVDQATAPIRRVTATIDRMAAPIRSRMADFRALGQAAGLPRVVSAVGRAGSALGRVGGELGSTLLRTTALAGAATAAVYGLVRSYTDAGDQAAEAAARIGVSVATLQELRFAASRGGIEAETLDAALLQQGKRIAEARQERGALHAMLERVRPALLAELKATRDQGRAFSILVEELHRTEDAQLRLALANAVWGRSGTQLLTLAEDGARGLERMAARARELGIVLSEEDARAAGEFDDSLGELFSSFTGLRNLLGSAVVPVLRSLVDQATRWIVSVRPQVAAFAREFAAGLPQRIERVVEWFRRMHEEAQPLISAGRFLIDTFGPANVLLGALALTVGGPLIAALVALVPAIYAVGAALLATPFGWFLGLAAAVVAVAYVFVNAWDEALAFVTALWDGLTDAVRSAVGWVERFLGLAPIEANARAAPRSSGGVRSPEFFAGSGGAAAPRDDRVRVEFENVPPGVKVRRESGEAVELDVGYSMAPL